MTDLRLIRLRVELYGAAQMLKGEDLAEFWTLIDEIAQMPGRPHGTRKLDVLPHTHAPLTDVVVTDPENRTGPFRAACPVDECEWAAEVYFPGNQATVIAWLVEHAAEIHSGGKP